MFIRINCAYCDKAFGRSKKRHGEAIKHGWKQYCSPECQSSARVTSQKCVCTNPLCRKEFLRQNKEFMKSELHFCSRSCNTIYHNALKNKATRLRVCLRSGCNKFVRDKFASFCSRKCVDLDRHGRTSYSPERVIDEIQEFFKKYKRIPTKGDLGLLNRLTRRFFGTWNGAIDAAGFESNPVRFSKHFVANDGHPCDSLSEKIIDDWLFARKIPHEVKVKYPWNNGMSADFKVGKYWIELFGLTGQLKSYDRLMKIKLGKINEYKLNLISLYLGDLFPSNRLGEKLGVLQR